MSEYPNATWQVGTVTLGASGGSEASYGFITPVYCNSVFRSLSLQIHPKEVNAAYSAHIYFGGELFEEHSFPDASGKTIMKCNYPGALFAPTIGMSTHPNFFLPSSYEPNPLSVSVLVVNLGLNKINLQVESLFEAFDTYVAKKLS